MKPPSQESPKLSVLIPAYNEEELIRCVVDSVHASFTSVGFDAYEVIVCDNNSTDRTAEIAADAGARVVFEPHNQIARARNAAASQARGEWLIFLDGDTFLNPKLLQVTIDAFRSGSICAGGAVVAFDRPHSGIVTRALTRFWNLISSRLGVAAGSFVFCLRAAWAEVGGFEEAVYAGEELFFSRKLKRWAKIHGQRFHVFATSPVITSARKLEWYGQWELLRRFLWIVVQPQAIRHREACGLWYKRPSPKPEKQS
jgi:glycosyltransferase involved in cell wall biosynthesis